MASFINNRILHVDLSTQRLWIEEPEDAFYRKYGGGSAMGLYYLLKELPPHTEPLSPQNILAMFTALPTGLPIHGQSRLDICTKSPLSGGIGDSQAGGFFPAALKTAGFDGIVVRGSSKTPVYLYLHDGEAELRPAEQLWGKSTGETEEILQAELGSTKIEVLAIGPAGENLVRLAAIMNMHARANGRTGVGAVMGSKKLKAVVVAGSKKISATDAKAFTALARQGAHDLDDNPDVKDLQVNGTAGVVPFQHSIGSLPTFNYTHGQFEAFEQISGETMTATILTARETCFACAVRCKRAVEAEFEEQGVLPTYGGPEYETLGTLGSYCGISDLKAIALGNQMCNKYGLDTIGTGATIAFAMECFEHGLITEKDTDGISLKFGNASAMIAMIEKIAHRQGFGNLLAEGSQRAAAKIGKGSEAYLVTVKGTEAPAHMPQAKRSLGLIYAVNPFGADHQSSEHDPMYEEGAGELYLKRLALLGLTEPQPVYEMTDEKVRFAYWTEVFYSAMDSLCLCQFVWGPAWSLYGPAELVAMLQAATGWNFSLAEVIEIGMRRLNMMRAFNLREGFTREQDVLPIKFSKPLEGTGPTAGMALDPVALEHFKDIYYSLAGWDVATGNPTAKRLAELGLDWVTIN